MDVLSIILTFVGLILLILLILWLYKSYKSDNPVQVENKKLLDGQHDATEYSSISKDEIPISVQGNEYSISMWLFIKDYNYRYGSNKVLLYRGDKDNSDSNPYIYFEPETNNMKIKVQLQTSKDKSSSSTEHFRVTMPLEYYKSNVSGNEVIIGSQLMDSGIDNSYEKECTIEPFDPTTTPGATASSTATPPVTVDTRLDRIELQLQKIMASKDGSNDGDSNQDGDDDYYDDTTNGTSSMPKIYDECTVKDIPIQKWVHVVITVTNNSIEVYLDGKLYQTCPIKGSPKPSLDNMHVSANGGFNGYIAQLQYSNMALPFTTIKKIYNKGPQLKSTMIDKVKGVGTATKNLFVE
jgi:hypothetical protein